MVPAEMEMVGRGLARGSEEVRRGDTPSGGRFDARVAGGVAGEGGARHGSGQGEARMRSEEDGYVSFWALARGEELILGTLVAGRVAGGRR